MIGCSLLFRLPLHVERGHNFCHCSARTAVERAIKEKMALSSQTPFGTCQSLQSYYSVCVMLHNHARLLKLEVPSDSESDSNADSDSSSGSSEDADSDVEELSAANNNPVSGWAQAAAGKAARERIINNYC